MRDRLGPPSSARCLILSVDFGEVARLQHAGDWDALTATMVEAARALERGGAEAVMLCTNTMHRVADAVAAGVDVPLLHIADPVGEAVRAAGVARVGLLGTRFTMEGAFLRERLAARYGLEVVVPDEADRAEVHRVIYEELVAGRIELASRDAYRAVMARLVARGVEAVVLGCTEIMMLVGEGDCAVPLFDTTALHAAAAVEWSLAG